MGSSWSSSRWRAVRSQKANLALFIIGLCLIALAPVWRFAVAPAIKLVATDFDRISFYSGTLTTYVRAPGQPAVGAEPSRAPVTIQARYWNPVGRSTTEVALLQVDTQLIGLPDKERLSKTTHKYAIDRRTAEQVSGHGSDMDRKGYYYVFPFDTPSSDLEVWDDLSAATQTAAFSRSENAYGVDLSIFTVKYAGVPVPAPAGFPTKMTGAQFKAMAPAAGYDVGDADELELTYRGNLSTEFLVEPISGTEVGVTGAEESVFVSVEDRARGLSFTQVIFKLDYKETAASIQEGANFAKGEIAKIDLQFVYLPVFYLALGIACVLIGFFAVSTKEERALEASVGVDEDDEDEAEER